MLKIFLFGLLLAAHFNVLAQEPDFSLEGIQLIGIKSLSDDGMLLLSSKPKNQGIELSKISDNLELEWQSDLNIEKLKFYHFNKMQIEHSKHKIYLLNHADSLVHLTIVDRATGSIYLENSILNVKIATEDDFIHCTANDSFISIYSKSNNLFLCYKYYKDSLVSVSTAAFIEPPLSIDNYSIINTDNSDIYTYTYTPSKNHSKLNLELQKTNLHSGDTLNRSHELKLEFTSFTYNSTIDNNLMYFYTTDEGFYAVGKLDIAFKNDYPTTKLTEGCIGFWIAKFNKELELIYLTEIPFQFFQGLVVNDMLAKAAVIDIKEDLNTGLFVSITEMRGIIYGKKYVINLDSQGMYTTFIGGQDAYHFFEYDRMGLRKNGKAYHLRLMNDDWSYYATSYLHMLDYNPQFHSAIIGNILHLKDLEHKPEDGKIYNFLKNEKSVILMEYIDRKGGLLNFYRFQNN